MQENECLRALRGLRLNFRQTAAQDIHKNKQHKRCRRKNPAADVEQRIFRHNSGNKKHCRSR